MKCFGRNIAKDDNHCCWVNGVECPFLERGVRAGYIFSCQLRRENVSWRAAVADPRYTDRRKNSPGRFFAQFGYDCDTFQCEDCGLLERGDITREEFNRRKNT